VTSLVDFVVCWFVVVPKTVPPGLWICCPLDKATTNTLELVSVDELTRLCITYIHHVTPREDLTLSIVLLHVLDPDKQVILGIVALVERLDLLGCLAAAAVNAGNILVVRHPVCVA
jgi:hypothetical protein